MESSDDDIDPAASDDPFSAEDALRQWAISTNQTYDSIAQVMDIVRKVSSCNLPKDARTLLKINRKISADILTVEGGQYWYYGVQKCLTNKLSNTSLNSDTTLLLNVSIDGLPIFKSNNLQFWPILINIHNMPEIPVMIVSIYSGTKKPSIEYFLKQFIEEINLLTSNGVQINDVRVDVVVRAIIADSPARAFIKGVANFNSFDGCLKCTTKGVKMQGRTTFLDCSAPKRTDRHIRKRKYGGHHKLDSPLLLLNNFDLVKQIIVCDQLHLIDLGVTKRILIGLLFEIHRKFRSLHDVNHWKGSEFSSFLYYASFSVLKNIMSDEQHKHYMLYFCSITLFSSNIYKEHWLLANNLITLFVKKYVDVYGPQFISSNVHNLTHIFEEVDEFGPLRTLSSYLFENALQHIKNLLRNGWRSLEQVINRIAEQEAYYVHKKDDISSYPSIKQRGNITTLHVRKGFCLKPGHRDGWFLTKSGNVCQYINVVAQENVTSLKIIARKLSNSTHCFDYPFTSKLINMHRGNLRSFEETEVQIDLQDVKCKLVAVPLPKDNEFDFVPLVHTLIE
ncbi:AGAP002950-PA [Anopheles gambiae str. PEST]|uniref:AGAP002950-PA n=1 Tax=Anopheles gambiae TaxID=7165 RepID=A7USS0_ANOGA|nr:AGAP002950-PA [Anopheles gambiae str. PEST]